MSYDFTVRSDADYSQQTDAISLSAFIASLPDMELNGQQGFVYGQSQSLHMELDLELMEDGEAIDEDNGKVNCISCHIPYAFLTKDNKLIYMEPCCQIAQYLGWQAYDEQTGENIDLKAMTPAV